MWTVDQLKKWIADSYWDRGQVAGWGNLQFFRRAIYRQTSDGAVHAGLPPVLNADGVIDQSMLTGTALAEYIADTVGAMVTGNTETGISVTYDDSDNTLDFDAQTAGDARYVKQDGSTAINGNQTINGALTVLLGALGTPLEISATATGDDVRLQFRQVRGTTANGTQATLSNIAIPASTTLFIFCLVVARRTGGSAGTAEDGASYGVVATFKNVAGTATQIGTTTVLWTNEDQAGWDATLDASGANARIRVTGAANNNVTWHATSIVGFVGS